MENKKINLFAGSGFNSLKKFLKRTEIIILIILLGACSEDAKFSTKDGTDSISSSSLPKRNPSFIINDDSGYTMDPALNIRFYPDGSAREMFISLDSECKEGSWEPFKKNKIWTIEELNKDVSVYVKYKYKYDESPCLHKVVTHDDKAPVIQFDEKFKNVWIENVDLDVSFKAEDFGSGVDTIECELSGEGQFKPCDETVRVEAMEENRDYKLTVRVRDKVGNSVTESVNWKSDQTHPQITFNEKPSAVTNVTDPLFSFTAVDFGSGVAEYFCRLDNEAQFKKCKNEIIIGNLKDGQHRLDVKAVDRVGRASQVISHSWIQDRNAPTLVFSETPPALTKERKARFTFFESIGSSGQSKVISYQCRLGNRDEFQPCGSPYDLHHLSDGSHLFSVIGFDEAGNKSLPIEYSWTVDTVAPSVSFSIKPDDVTSSNKAHFSFSARDEGSEIKEYYCRMDGESYKICNNFLNFSDLSSGFHAFSVKAVDRAGNVSDVIQHQWLIDLTKPEVRLVSKPEPYTKNDFAQISFVAEDRESGIAERECRLDNGSFTLCESPSNYTDLSEGDHYFSVRVRDKADNVSSIESHQWSVDRTGPEIVFDLKPSESVVVGSEVKIKFNLEDRGSGLESYLCTFNGMAHECNQETLHTFLMDGYSRNSFQIEAVDKIGNKSVKNLHWTSRFELLRKRQNFKVETDRPVDILFVVDNSRSMEEERKEMARKIDGFIGKLDGLDWQIAVTSTETHQKDSQGQWYPGTKYYQNGRLIPFDGERKWKILDSSMDINITQQLFGGLIQSIPLDIHGREQGVYATVRAIERALDGQGENASNSDFFRANAHLAVVVLSDEDENSEGEDVLYNPAQFLFFIQNSLGVDKKVTWHSIVVMSGDSACRIGHSFYGTNYEKLSKLTGHGQPGGAVIGSICADDYTEMLKDIGQSVKDKHNTLALECEPSNGGNHAEPIEFQMSHKPVDGSSNYEPYLSNYKMQGQTVVFEKLLEPGDYKFEYNCRK